MESFQLSTIDFIIMVTYALFIIGYGLYHAKRKSSEDYFLAGRNMIWPVVGISLFAANISSSTLVGLAGAAYKTDTHVFNYEWLAAVVLVFFAIFFLPFYLRSKVYTMPEFLERRYDRRSRYYFSFIMIVGNVMIDTAAALYVGSIVLQLIFPGVPSWLIIVILAAAAAAYTIPGGLSSVIHTEVLQAILLIIGSIVLTLLAFGEVGGWSGMMAGLDAKAAAGEFTNPDTGVVLHSGQEVLSMFRGSGQTWGDFFRGTGPGVDGFMPWTGLLVGAPILGFYFWANNQFMVQRVLGAKDINHGRWGAIFAGFLKLPVVFIMVLPGTLAILMYGGVDISNINYQLSDGKICQQLIDCPDATYPVLLFDLLPKGLLGLVVAGLLAAMMSSISATFNSASTLVTMDFFKQLRPNLTSDQLVRIGQITTLVLVVLASLWAPLIGKAGGLWEYLQKVLAYISPPVAAVFIVGMFWKRANANGAIAALIFGFFMGCLIAVSAVFCTLYGDEANGLFQFIHSIHFLHQTFFLFVLCIIVEVVVSLRSALPPDDKIRDYTWSSDMIAAETEELKGLPWYQNYRILSVFLLIATAIVVWIFR